MSAKEKATTGVRLLKEAVLQFVADNPGSTTKEVQEALDLFSPNEHGDYKDQLLWGIDNLLRAENKIRFKKENNRNRRYCVEATQE